MSKITTVMLDLDDTLIPNAYSYYLPLLDACRLICIDLVWQSPRPSDMMKRAIEIQLEDIKVNQRINKGCFPNSWIQVYKEACKSANRAPNPAITGAIALSTEKYFLETYHTYEGVKDFLTKLQDANVKKICVTRGDYDIQYYKIQNTLLEGYFDELEIVPIKTVDTYCQILDRHKLIADETLMVGDSIKNDILPAMQCGIRTLHLTDGKVEWDDPDDALQNEASKNPLYQPIQSLNEVLNYLDKNSTNRQSRVSV